MSRVIEMNGMEESSARHDDDDDDDNLHQLSRFKALFTTKPQPEFCIQNQFYHHLF